MFGWCLGDDWVMFGWCCFAKVWVMCWWYVGDVSVIRLVMLTWCFGDMLSICFKFVDNLKGEQFNVIELSYIQLFTLILMETNAFTIYLLNHSITLFSYFSYFHILGSAGRVDDVDDVEPAALSLCLTFLANS